MNKYRNIVTGAVITTPCTCAGDNWEPVKGKRKAQPEKKEEPAPEEDNDAQDPEEEQPASGGIEIGPAPEEEKEAAPAKSGKKDKK